MSNFKEATPKEQILSKLRNALTEKTNNPYENVDLQLDVIKSSDPDEEPEVLFAQELIALGGQFVYCENEHDFLFSLTELMREFGWASLWSESPYISDALASNNIPYFTELPEELPAEPIVSITPCEKLITASGTIVMSDANGISRASFAYPDIHLVLAFSSQVVPNIKTALDGIRKKYEHHIPPQLTFITGPSRTADIEKTLVKGAHGPTQLFVFLIDDL